jgi:hypothetical protein
MSNPINDGGPAFPQQAFINTNGQVVTPSDYFPDASGMSLRDWFAGMALQGLVSSAGAGIFTAGEVPRYEIASYSYKYADAMIAAREAKEEAP